MLKAGDFLILDTQKAFTEDKYEKPIPSTRNVPGRKLADISNLPQKPKPIIQGMKPLQSTARDYTDQLQKENMALEKTLQEKNKIIEKSGIQLEILRVNLLKMQEQNHLLALSNMQMLAELNSGKDRLKALQHELGCKTGILRVIQLELEEKSRKQPFQSADAEVMSFQAEGRLLKDGRDQELACHAKRRLPSNSLRFSEQVQSKEMIERKRPFVRRQSARFKPIEVDTAESLDERDDAMLCKYKLPDDPQSEDGSICVNASSKKYEDNECSSDLCYAAQGFGRSSLSRPSRTAAKKVQSYKEVPLNIKMRRP